ncbi:MAG: hydrolase [Candidatus Pacearchaeota archaeon]|nr:MAG: hydrolase [Candidatus Pacearchaeota archaeon]
MECIFCKISKGEIKSRKIYENKNFFSIFDINPVSEGHSLVISKEHFENFLDLRNNLGDDLIECVKETISIIKKEKPFEGFNLVNNNSEVAGQIVKHFHLHIIPRRKGEKLKSHLF